MVKVTNTVQTTVGISTWNLSLSTLDIHKIKSNAFEKAGYMVDQNTLEI